MNHDAMPVFPKGPEKAKDEPLKKGEEVNNGAPSGDKDAPVDDVVRNIKKAETKPSVFRRIPEEQKQWYGNMRSAGVRILNGGFLEITRWDNTGKNFAKPRLMRQTVEGINSAIRMQDHILGGYRSQEKGHENEYSKIESIQEVIECANDLLNRWGTVNPETKKEIQWQLAGVVLQLEKCRNEFKTSVRDQAGAVMKLKDSRDRENPSALAARTVSALNNLVKRTNEMQLIAPRMALRKEVLVLEKRRIEGALRKADMFLSGVLHHAVFNANPKTAPESRINGYEVDIIDRKLGQILYLLDTIYVTPYLQQAEQAKSFIFSKAKKYFRSKKFLVENLDSAKEALEEAQRILRSNVEHLG